MEPSPENPWHIACPAHELKSKPVSTRLAGQALVLFRDERGRATAMPNRCPHRGVPLSMGSCASGRLRCAYHGWEFDAHGVCQLIPGTYTETPLRAMLEPCSVIEQDGYVWILAGEAAPGSSPPSIGLEGLGWQRWNPSLGREAGVVRTALRSYVGGRGGTWLDAWTVRWEEQDGARVVCHLIPESETNTRIELLVGRPRRFTKAPRIDLRTTRPLPRFWNELTTNL